MYFHGVTMVNREKYGKTEEPLEFLILKMALLLFWVIREGWASCGSAVKNPPANAGVVKTLVPSLGLEDPHCSILAWRSPWTEEAGGLQSVGSQRVGHD